MWRSVWGCEWIAAGNGPSSGGARSSELWVGLGEVAAEAGTATSDALIKGVTRKAQLSHGAAGRAQLARCSPGCAGSDGRRPRAARAGTRRGGCAEPEAGSAGAPRPRPRAPGRRRSSSAFRGFGSCRFPSRRTGIAAGGAAAASPQSRAVGRPSPGRGRR